MKFLLKILFVVGFILGFSKCSNDHQVDPVSTAKEIRVNVKVQLKVGDIDYVNVDTKILVTGFNSDNKQEWQQEFSYEGPDENELILKSNCQYYSFEFKQWGIYSKQTIIGSYLSKGRSDGPDPTTLVLSGAIASRKISHYINYYEQSDPDQPGKTFMAAQYKVGYDYNVGNRIDKMTFYAYSNETKDFISQRYFVFSYENNRVSKIFGYQSSGTLYSEDVYQYNDNGEVTKITEKNYGTAITSEVNLSYNLVEGLINASYTFSNGGSFNYQFVYSQKNIKTDKITRNGSLCSEGIYGYDKNINPLKHLGYVDFLLQNYSVNNRMTEQINYIACAFPTLIPDSYNYTYDEFGYPKVATTLYKKGDRISKSETNYYYQ